MSFKKIVYLFVGLIQMYQHEPLVAVIVYEWYIIYLFLPMNHFGGVIVSVLISSAVDRGVYGLRSSQAKAYAPSPLSTQLYVIRSNNWLAQNKDNVEQHVFLRTVVSVS